MSVCSPNLPIEAKQAKHVYHQYAVRAKDRDRLVSYLKEQGIGPTVYYPVTLHRQTLYADLGCAKSSPSVSEMTSVQVLSLPMYPQLSQSEIDKSRPPLIDSIVISPNPSEAGRGELERLQP